MKIKDLPDETNLVGMKVKVSDELTAYWRGQWSGGVFLSKDKDTKMFPYTLQTKEEYLDWEIVD